MNNPYPPNADATQAGLMTPAHVEAVDEAQTAADAAASAASAAQADATQAKAWSNPATSKTMGNSGTTQTFATLAATVLTAATELVSPLVRAISAAAVLRSDLGGTSGDVVTKVGSSVADGSVNSTAKLFSVRTGIGGTESEKAYLDKTGKFACLAEVSFGRILRDTSALGIWGVSSIGNGGELTRWETLSSLSSGWLGTFANNGTNVYRLSVAGMVSQYGSDSSGTPGNATIARPIGKSAIAAGASSCVITNSLVAAGDWVMITPHARDTTCKELIAVCTANTITVSGNGNATAALPFSWEVKKRI